MAVFQLLAISSPTATGSQTYNHSLGVVPKAAIAFSVGISTFNQVTSGTYHMVGFTDGSAQFAASWASTHASSISNTSRVVSNSLVHFASPGETTFLRANLTSWSSTGLTLNWTKVWTSEKGVYLLLIGGDDVSAKALQVNSPTVTVSQAVTGVGFAPDLALFLNAGDFGNALGTPATHGAFGLGVAERYTPSQWAVAVASEDNVNPSDTYRAQRTGRCVLGLRATDGTQLLAAGLQSWDSDGVTLSWATVGTAPYPVPVLFLKGLRAKALVFTAPTASGSQAVTGVGFQPEVLILASFWDAAVTTLADAQLSIGSATGATSEQSINVYNQDNVSPTNAKSYHATDHILVEHTASVVRTAGLISLGSDGFALSWSAAGNEDQVVGLALATEIVQKSASDSVVFSASESLLVEASLARADLSALSASELAQVALPGRSDSGSLSAVELAQTSQDKAGSDAQALAAVESASLLGQSSTGDLGSLLPAESGRISLGSGDAGSLAASESRSVGLVASDSGPVTVTESAKVWVFLSEAQALSTVEGAGLLQDPGPNDHLLFGVEGVSVVGFPARADGGTLSATEAAGIVIGVQAQDAHLLGALEGLELLVLAREEPGLSSLEQPQARPPTVTGAMVLAEMASPQVRQEVSRSSVETRLLSSTVLVEAWALVSNGG